MRKNKTLFGNQDGFAIELFQAASSYEIALWLNGKKAIPVQQSGTELDYVPFNADYFISCLSNAWVRLFVEQTRPIDNSSKEIEEFKKAHDVGLWIGNAPEILFLRQGNEFEVFLDEEPICAINFNTVQSMLTNLGSKLILSKYVSSQTMCLWTQKTDKDKKEIVRFASGISLADKELQDVLNQEIKETSFAEIVNDLPVLALARMAHYGGMNVTEIKSLINTCKEVFRNKGIEKNAQRYSGLTRDTPSDVYDRHAYPFEQGYSLAEYIRSKTNIFINENHTYEIENFAKNFGIQIVSKEIPEQVEALALWYDKSACIVTNTKTPFGSMTAQKRRFIIAHEMCHYLVDKCKARPLGHVLINSTGEMPLEQRANAFAAELLLPRKEAILYIQGKDDDVALIAQLAEKYFVSQTVAANQISNGASQRGIQLSLNIKKYITNNRAGQASFIGENQSVRHIISRIESFKTLPDGWCDGEGQAASNLGINWMRRQVLRFLAWDIGEPAVFPSPDGTIELEWREGQSQAFLEIDLLAKKAEWYTFSLNTPTNITQKEISLSRDDDWKIIVQLLESFMKGARCE